MAKIQLSNFTYFYPEANNPALANINLVIEPGEVVALLGTSGSGKSTLLKTIAGLVPGFHGGKSQGKVFIENKEISTLSRQEIVQKVALLFQEPEHQIVKTKVENEIAFTLENLGIDDNIMKSRVAEVSTALNLVMQLDSFIQELSGGTKQKVVLASALTVHPDILLLDEPISQLDPIAAQEFLDIIHHINEDFGVTVVITEHRLENILKWVDRVVVIENGNIIYSGKPNEYCLWAQENGYKILPDLPRLFAYQGYKSIPLDVKEAQQAIKDLEFVQSDVRINQNYIRKDKPVITLNKVHFSYGSNTFGLNNINFSLNKGEFATIIGHNGAGKSTFLKLLAGIYSPQKGQIYYHNNYLDKHKASNLIGYIPQNPDDFLYLPTVEQELTHDLKEICNERLENILEILGLKKYRHCNPKDLSFGQKQRVVLASVIIRQPEILLLDEPTRGLDYELKEQLGQILMEVNSQGTTILMISNDMEFIAKYTQTIIVMSRGQIINCGNKYDVLADSRFFASQINRVFKCINKQVLSFDEAVKLLNLINNDKEMLK